MKSIFTEGKKYTFSDYFELGSPTEEIIRSLGYSFFTQPLDLPRKNNKYLTNNFITFSTGQTLKK